MKSLYIYRKSTSDRWTAVGINGHEFKSNIDASAELFRHLQQLDCESYGSTVHITGDKVVFFLYHATIEELGLTVRQIGGMFGCDVLCSAVSGLLEELVSYNLPNLIRGKHIEVAEPC